MELGQPGRRRLPIGAAGVAHDLPEQLSQGRETHRLGRAFQLGGLDQPAVDALRKPLQVGTAGKKQRPLGICRPGGRPLRRSTERDAAAFAGRRPRAPPGRCLDGGIRRGGELAHPVAQQEVDRDRGLAAAGGAGQQQRRLAVQQPRLLAGQEQVQLEVVALVGRLQAAPLFLVHHQPALRPGVSRGLGARHGDRLVQRGREVVTVQIVGDELRQLLDQSRLEVEKRRVGGHDAALGGAHVIVFDHPPHVDAGGTRAVAVGRLAQGEQDAVATAEPRLEHGAPAALELLDPHPGVPQALLQELQLLAQALLCPGVQGHHVGAHHVVQKQGVVAWHGSKSGGPRRGRDPQTILPRAPAAGGRR